PRSSTRLRRCCSVPVRRACSPSASATRWCTSGVPGREPGRRSGWHDGAVTDASVLRPIIDDDRRAVARLWQLYSHDLSEFRDSRPNAQGLFRTGRLPTYYDDPDSTGFVITRDGSLAGFAFVMGLMSP